ncbi:polyprotein [Phytophthora megakarya]|uniref:Polyprotein n=1 Tax=Phytophthora megakarya TaxID=4795 RepID=A0A225VHP2_9STRA|nr:polyprotein [Phytophthora megakarya]
MNTIKILAKKLDVGVKVNERGLAPYQCVACAASKAKGMTFARVPVRKSLPLEKLMVDICSVSEPTVDGATMFLLVMDEATRFKWVYLMKAKSEATWHIKVLANRLRVRFPGQHVRRLHFDQSGELAGFCGEQGIELTTTNSYSPQEYGIVERANGIVLPRVKAMLTATHLPNFLWGEALLHVVTTLNHLPTRPLGLVSPHKRLWKEEPALDDLRTCGCLAHVRIPPESIQKKEKLSPRVRLSLLLGYETSTPGYKFLDLVTALVVTARGGNVRFHEEFTCEGTYAKQLLENAYLDGDHGLPENVHVARIKTSMETYLLGWSVELAAKKKQLELVSLAAEPAEDDQSPAEHEVIEDLPVIASSDELVHGVVTPAAEKEVAKEPSEVSKARKRRKRKARKKNAAEVKTDEVAVEGSPAESSLKRPRQKHKANVRLADYVVGNVLVAEEVSIPTTYKQAHASGHWPQWKAAMLAELQSLKAITCRWVFAVKRDERGRVKRFKARLVIRGFKQQQGVNYNKTYAPVIRFETIRAAI